MKKDETMEKIEGFEDLEDLDDSDIDERPLFYEVWVLGDTETHEATEFDYLVDDGYTELEEAKKCFEYFVNKDTLLAYLENKNINIPDNVKHLRLVIEMCRETEDGEGTECIEILEETEIY